VPSISIPIPPSENSKNILGWSNFQKCYQLFIKTTAKKIHSIFNLESFFDFFGDASQKSYQKRYMLI